VLFFIGLLQKKYAIFVKYEKLLDRIIITS